MDHPACKRVVHSLLCLSHKGEQVEDKKGENVERRNRNEI